MVETNWDCLVVVRELKPRGSKYPIFEVSGPNYNEGYGFWN